MFAALLSFLLLADTLTGVVTYSGDEVVFLQAGRKALKMRLPIDAQLPTRGSVISAEGREVDEGGRRIFAATAWKNLSKAAIPDPISAESGDLVVYSADPSSGVNWRRVTVEGRAIALTERGFAMKIGELPVNIFSDELPDFLDDCADTRPKVRVTGIAELIVDPTSLSEKSRYVMGVKILAESKSSIILESDLSYLMNRRDKRLRIAYFSILALTTMALLLLIIVLLRSSRKQLRTRTLMQERKRMADDLHDTIEQHLVGAGMLLQLGKVKESREILVRAKKEMRDIVWGLKNDDMMRLTPAEMIRELAKEENRKGICRVDVMLKGMPDHLDAGAMRDLSLIVREAIGNAVKHGAAKKIAIASDSKECNGWRLRISNDGAPYDSATALGTKDGHFGVDGMRQRARRLNAELSISVLNERTVVNLETL